MRKSILLAAVAAGLAVTGAYVQAQPATAPRAGAPAGGMQQTTAQDFVSQAAVSSMFEIQSSKLVLGKLKSGRRGKGNAGAGQGDDQVREFAQQMVQDHTKADKELKATLKQARLKMTPPKKLDQPHQQMLQQLKSGKGDQAARDYATMQVQAHQDAVTLFQSYAQNGDNPQLKQFAQQTLPALQQHLEMAQQLPK